MKVCRLVNRQPNMNMIWCPILYQLHIYPAYILMHAEVSLLFMLDHPMQSDL